jgi:O-succinylbenzoic acid--CoA ligase
VVRAVLGSKPVVESEIAVVLATSGSTGNPRGVELTAAALTHAAPAIHDGLRPCWVAAIPLTSAGGFNVVVRALQSGLSPVAISALGGAGPFTSDGFADAIDAALNTGSPVFTSLVPAQLPRLLADERGTEALRACTRVLIGGAPLRRSLAQTCRDLGISVSTTYGMTESSGGCVIDGVPLPGVGVEILDPDHTGAGRVVVSGPTIARRYRDDPEASAAVFVDGAFRTSDLGQLRTELGESMLSIIGRMDDVVIISGVNVSVSAVESVIADQPHVEAAAVVSAGSDHSEPVLVAFVAHGTGDVDLAALQARVADRLGRAATPRRVIALDRLPYLPNGKIDRIALMQRAQEELLGGPNS